MPVASLEVNLNNNDIELIPVSKNIDIEALKKDDENYVEVVAEIPVSTSKRGWNYTEKAIKDVVNDVNDGKVIGIRGHQEAKNIGTEFPNISTIWTGAIYDDKNKMAKVRGIIDKSDEDLKRWVKSGVIKNVSIFGEASLKKNKDKSIDVTGYKTMSIDWTPPERNGMKTTVKVYKKASGEMADVMFDSMIVGELDGSFEELREGLATSLNTYFGSTSENSTYVWIKRTYEDNCICEVSDNEKNTLYNVQFGQNNDNIELGSITQVKEVVSYEPVNSGEMEGNNDMAKNENNNNVEIKEVIPEDLKKVIGEMKSEDLENILKDYKIIKEKEAKIVYGEMVDKVLGEEIQNEEIKTLIKDLYTFKGIDEKAIKGEIAEVLELPAVKRLTNTTFKAPENNTNNSGEGNERYGIAWKKAK